MAPTGHVARDGIAPRVVVSDDLVALTLPGIIADSGDDPPDRSPLGRLATFPAPVLFLLAALSYWALGFLGIALSYPPGVASPLWPPAGIALLFMMIVSGRKALAWTSAGVFAGEFGADLSHGVDLLPTLGYSIGTLAYIPAAVLLRRWGLYGRGLVNQVGDVITFIVLATLAGAANGLVALIVATAEGHGSANFFLTWSTGNVLGIILFVPLAVTWLGRRHPILAGATWRGVLPWLLLLANLVTVVGAVAVLFSAINPFGPVGLLAPYVLSALIMLGAWRLGPPAATVLLTVASVGTALQTAAGRGPFAKFTPNETEALYTSQLAFAVLITTILLMAAVRVQLSSATQRYRTLFEEAPAMYVVARPVKGSGLVLVDCNKRFLDAVGRPSADVIGQPLAEFVSSYTPPADSAPEKATSGQPVQEEHELMRRDGEKMPVLMQAVQVADESDRSGIRAMLVDLTDRRRAERLEMENELIRQQQLALLGTLLAGIAHEVKNPLNFVVNFAEIAQELAGDAVQLVESGDDPEELKAILGDVHTNADTIAKHGKRALDVMMGMLALSQPVPPAPTPTDINALVQQYSELAFHGLRGRGIDVPTPVRFQLDPDLPETPIVAPDLGRVILNIVGNACDAIVAARAQDPKSTAEVTASTRCVADTVEIEIRDTGIGITEEVRARIFEPFYTTKAAGEGTGLGLAICHDIIAKHGGEISVDSVVGRYTSFVVRLPRESAM